MTTRISTGTGLALLAGAIVFHAFMSLGTGSIEPKAEAAWTPKENKDWLRFAAIVRLSPRY